MDNKKLIIPLVLGGAGVLIARSFIKGEGAEPPPSEGGMNIVLIPGQPGTQAKAMGISGLTGSLTEDSVGNIAQVTVTNTSKRGTTPVPFIFDLSVNVSVGGITVLRGLISGEGLTRYSFAASEVKVFNFTFAIPFGVFGASTADAGLFTTATPPVLVNQASKNFTVVSLATVPGGTIVW